MDAAQESSFSSPGASRAVRNKTIDIENQLFTQKHTVKMHFDSQYRTTDKTNKKDVDTKRKMGSRRVVSSKNQTCAF